MNFTWIAIVLNVLLGLHNPDLGFSNTTGSQTTISNSTLLTFTNPVCIFGKGETIPKCEPGARWIELLKVTNPGEGDLVCGVLETKDGVEWRVFDARMYCIRGDIKK